MDDRLDLIDKLIGFNGELEGALEGLNHKQRLFVFGFVESGNASRAYKLAGYSANNADQAAHRLKKKNVKVVRAIGELSRAIELKAADDAVMKREEALVIVSEVGKATLADFFDDGGNLVFYGERVPKHAVKEVHQWTDDKGDKHVKIKLHDKLGAIKQLAVMNNWEPEKVVKIDKFEEFINAVNGAKVLPSEDGNMDFGGDATD